MRRSDREAAGNAIRRMTDPELEAAVEIARIWKYKGIKSFDGLATCVTRVGAADDGPGASRCLRRLEELGLFDEETDEEDPRVRRYTGLPLLWIIKETAARSGLFPERPLPPPRPETLGELLKYPEKFGVKGSTWYAETLGRTLAIDDERLPQTTLFVLGRGHRCRARVVDYERELTWIFTGPTDHEPVRLEGRRSLTELFGPVAQWWSPVLPVDLPDVSLDAFDDLGALQ